MEGWHLGQPAARRGVEADHAELELAIDCHVEGALEADGLWILGGPSL